MDAGLSQGALYPCDCTRCWPLGTWQASIASTTRTSVDGLTKCIGENTLRDSLFGRRPEHRVLYEALLRVQRKLLCSVRAGVDERALQPLMISWLFQDLLAVAEALFVGQQQAVKAPSRQIVSQCVECERWIQSVLCPHTLDIGLGMIFSVV